MLIFVLIQIFNVYKFYFYYPDAVKCRVFFVYLQWNKNYLRQRDASEKTYCEYALPAGAERALFFI